MPRDRQVVTLYRYFVAALTVGGTIYLCLSASYYKWLYVLVGWIGFALFLIAHHVYVWRKIFKNFERINQKTGGVLKRGSYILSVPPSLKFKYADRTCRIGHSVDPNLDHQIEYACPVNQEIELRITRKNASGKFVAQGADRDVVDTLLRNLQNKILLEELMHQFSGLYLGKDGHMRLTENYDSYLTDPQRVFQTFDKMIKLAHFFEARVRGRHR